MYRNAGRSLIAALAAVATIGLAQPSMAQDNDPEEEQETSAEEAPAPSLEALMQALADALATLRSIEEQLQALQQAQTEAERKTLALSIPTGLSRSTETPVYSAKAGEKAIALARGALDDANARLAEAETDRADAQAAVTAAEAALASQMDEPHPGIAELLPNSEIRFAPLTAALRRDFQQTSVAVTDDAHVRAISSDGEGGFHVTYLIRDTEQTVHFEADEYNSESQSYRKPDGTPLMWSYTNSFTKVVGNTPPVWSWTDSFTEEDGNRNQGSTEFRYFEAYGMYDSPGYQLFMTYGVRTEADGFPADAATYAGRVRGDGFPKDNPNLGGRTRMWAALNLTADFEDGTIEGRINRIRIDPPGDNNARNLPYSTQFDIEHGRIEDGQFTATLTGVDTNADAATDDTVAGYKGDVLGEFYGPAAEEVGGVLNAESDAHNSVIGGVFGGRQLRSTVAEGVSATPSSAGVETDYVDSTVQTADDSGVTAISTDGGGGYQLTYQIDGVEHAVHMTGSNYGALPIFPTAYHKRIGPLQFYLYSPLASFFGSSEFDHFDVVGWLTQRDRASGTGTATINRGFLIHGTRTESDDLPAGEATYAGRMAGEIWQADNPDRFTRTFVRGDLSLTADFAESTVTGTVDDIEMQAPSQSYQASTEVLTINGGSITDSTFAADLTGTGGEDSRYEGDVDGQFFGPDAKEVGGVLEATHTGDSTILTGWFGGKRDDLAEVAASQ